MRFDLEGLEVFFPYDYVYPEQYAYMLELKRSIDAKGHCVLEMPTGTGKTISCLSLIISYKRKHPQTGKLIYCTRTVPEMEKVLEELNILVKYIEKELGADSAKLLAVGLSSRRNLCIHPQVSVSGDRDKVDAGCRSLTATWVRAASVDDPSIALCEYFEGFEKTGSDAVTQSGVFTLEELKMLGKEKKWCPYFLARHLINVANVVVYNYQYLLDPKIANMVSRELERECIIVFDECHNIDNACIEAFSVNINRQTLEVATRNLDTLNSQINKMKQTDARRLQDEYTRLVQGLQASGALRGGEDTLANPVVPSDILQEAVPGNIRRAEHFVAFVRRFTTYLKTRLRVYNVEVEGPLSFLLNLQKLTQIDSKTLRFTYDRLKSLMNTLEITDTEQFTAIQLVADFATLISTYQKGFKIIIEPFPEAQGLYDPLLQFCCLDASLAVKPVFTHFYTVILTSGTISPIELYPKILNFNPVTMQSFEMTMTRDCICPMVVTKGSDQVQISSKFDLRSDVAVVRNYGNLVIELSATVPDGIICFFTSYRYMEEIVSMWNEMDVLKQILQHKLLFIETKDVVETTLALENYRRACDVGRGAIFFSVARGKIAEGIDFDRHYGRAVIMIGIPFQYTLSRILQARLEYLNETFKIPESEFLTFDAIRQAAQCVGRVIRSKADYGIMVLADLRYSRHDKRDKLPKWIRKHLDGAHLNLSTDEAVQIARTFLRQMAQPAPRDSRTYLMDKSQLDQMANRMRQQHKFPDAVQSKEMSLD
eukprot:GILK01012308.1.p1 GENE.GILK01012308.1~~GILK01012308.1.p1  ORF type:complete len:767 (-),score=129.90 GILK01012308.1:182-2482(-)